MPARSPELSLAIVPSERELQESVFDLHQYLSDLKAPLMVADSVALLLRYPPDFLAAQIHAWVAAQALDAPVADYLYHGAKKIAMMGELELVSRDVLGQYLGRLGVALLPYCPEADRDLLKQNFERLGQAAPASVAGVAGILHRQSGSQAPAAAGPAATGETLSREVRRLSLLLEHLRPLASGTAAPERRTELASQFMTAAAVQSTSAKELEQRLAPLGQFGIETAMEQVFRTLAQSLAGWALPRVEGQVPIASREQLEAMRRIVALAEDPAEVAKRYRELVHAAIEQFNEGQLGRAMTMFELAERLAAERKVEAALVEPLRQGHEYLDQERLRRCGERSDQRAQLRPILSFFTALRPEGLLASLDGEGSRERRHQLLALLEVHEQAARSAAWERLKASVEPGAEVDPYFQMNLVYLLRIIPRPPEASVEDEVNVTMRVSGRSSPPPLVKQVIAYLAYCRHEKAERALATYLRVFESMLIQPDTAVYPPEDLEVLLDRTCAALARYGTPRAWRLLIDHGLKNDGRLGSPFLRLAEAGRLDLSSSRDLVERILAALRPELPKSGVLAFAAMTNEDKALALIQALAGTPLPEVQQTLQEIASKHRERRIGEAAAKALHSLANAAKPPAPAGLSGDLDLFGLPNLLQTIGQSQLTGVLSLMGVDGMARATLLFEGGLFRGGQQGGILGEEAVYQLLERPFHGTFAFVGRADVGSQPHVGPPQQVFEILMEGVRRYDEYKRAAAIVPDAARLKPTGKSHGCPESEDADFAVLVWTHVSSGKTPEQCEAAISTDGYRIRRLLANWVEEGALQQLQGAA